MRRDTLHDEPPPKTAPLQFRLRTLLWAVAWFSVLFAILTTLDGVWSVALVLLLSLVAAHVAGNALGRRLTESAPRRCRSDSPPLQRSVPVVIQDSPQSHLYHRSGLGRFPAVIAAAGAMCGGLGATVIFARQWSGAVSMGAVSMGAVAIAVGSLAVIGCFAGFLVSTFVQIGLWPAVCSYFKRPRQSSVR